jgi:hypothetical protein
MKQIFGMVWLALIGALLQPLAVSAVEPGNETARQLKIGLGIEVDAQWVSVGGYVRLDPAGGGFDGGGKNAPGVEWRIEAVPNLAERARATYTAFKTVRETLGRVLSHWLVRTVRDTAATDGENRHVDRR